ncbi:type II toxin-antitoxin system HipA family toxin [Parvularcula sp. ZS-1/3]|uniref:Type II toxin-antitoxin system HipA family toxin n=1 Tax=Parvularcula mediterranea TaxID=2732508 RepID=A0A7Y3W5F6_9PROT|nr:type II toxin-antitoxin system HipA family toxin [Parvularcula mediterranea]NNU16221.1 type II toxin-antitoxin system HipA family toxin [Parvularcula mediterranea]
MGRKRKSGVLTVALNGRVVGRLARAADGATRFDYAQEWLDWEYAIPVSRSMPLVDRPFTGLAMRAVFDNLLPDDDRIRARIAARVGADGTDAFSMLAALGRDCVGALQFLPEDMPPAPPGPPEGEPITAEGITERIRSLSVAPLGMRGGDDAFRISLAGAQNKTALLYHEGKWMVPTGTTPTTHILKPQIGMVQTPDGEVDLTDSVQNEHLSMALCRAFGLDVASTEILELEDDLRVLSIERFDRRLDSKGRLLRLPQEDMCQALGILPTGKYESDGGPGIEACLDLLKSSDQPDADRRAFIKAQIVFWLIGATDGHAKNFSLFLEPQGRSRLTPLYDILSTQWQHDRRQIARNAFRLAMAIGDKRRYKVTEIAPRHFEQTAKLAGFPIDALHAVMGEVVSELPRASEALTAQRDARVPAAMAEAIVAAATTRAQQIEAYLNG